MLGAAGVFSFEVSLFALAETSVSPSGLYVWNGCKIHRLAENEDCLGLAGISFPTEDRA